jgi:site-specific DNA recombinase
LGKECREGHEVKGGTVSTRQAVIYARVSSREQQQEGYSIDAQLKLARSFAAKNDFDVVREFVDIESAKSTGRREFGNMVEFLRRSKTCRTVLVEKTDRLSRNFEDQVVLNRLDLEIHFVKTGTVLSKNAKAQTKFMHGIELVSSRYYVDNLREEVIKGMREKAEQGIYPGRAPYGYINNKGTRAIEIHPQNAEIARYVFERYGTGQYSLLALSKDVRHVWGVRISKTNLHKMLSNPFYIGQFKWQGRMYQGTHPTLISADLYARAKDVLHGHNKPKYRKHDIAFRGLLTCAHDNCTVTAELKKNKYVYYRCSGGRGPCDLPRFREQEIADRLGHVLEHVSIPAEVAMQIEEELKCEHAHAHEHVARERARLARALDEVRRRMDAAYMDKLEGKISEGFWQRKQADWQEEETRIAAQIEGLKEQNFDDRLLDVRRILELAQNAHSLYLTRGPHEQAELLKSVLLNCSIDAVSLNPTYRSPFDLIVKRAESAEWSGREDLNLRPPGPEPGALPG